MRHIALTPRSGETTGSTAGQPRGQALRADPDGRLLSAALAPGHAPDPTGRRIPAIVTHVRPAGLLVWVWREPRGWAAATLRRTAHTRYATPEEALAAITGAWPHEPWLACAAAAAVRLDRQSRDQLTTSARRGQRARHPARPAWPRARPASEA